MRTSQEIYHRIVWDPRFDPARFVMGVTRRGAAPKRLPLPAFTPGGDIPWHRIVFFEADGEIVWDRASGRDVIDATRAGRVRDRRLLRGPAFTPRSPIVGNHGPGGAAPQATALRVLTWNTLWDRYDADRIDTARRRPLLVEALRRADADVIALQEVEPDLLEALRRTPWVADGYTLGNGPTDRDVAEYGLVLLSRLPVVEAGRHALGPHKAVDAITVTTATGPLVIAVTHLTSDHTPGGADRRAAELERLAEVLGGVDADLILLGDFNDGGDAPARTLGLRDAWSEAHGPDDATATFDPAANPLAAVSSLTGRAARLDRVLLRGPGLRVTAAELLGDSPATPDGLFISDHYGVGVDIALTEDSPGSPDAASTARTAPAWFPPEAFWSAPRHDPASGQWPKVVQRVRTALPEGVVHVAGSRRMGCHLPGADLDLVVALPGTADVEDVEARVRQALPEASGLRRATGARLPGLRLRAGGLGVDLLVVATGNVPPTEAVPRRGELPEGAALALSAVSDADAVTAAVGADHPAFVALARHVKAWAKARGLDSAPCGGLPGIAWSVLAARTVQQAPGLPPDDLLRHFFGTWAAWDWRDPITLCPDGQAAAAGPPLPVRILTPSAPVRPCSEQVGTGMRDLLTQEFYTAWELLESDGPQPVSPPPLHQRHAAWAVVTIRADRPEELEHTLGRVRGRMRSLLTALEEAGAPDAHAWPRPFEAGPGAVCLAIGLGRTPPGTAVLAGLARRWTDGLHGVEVERVDAGRAPTLR